MSSQESAVGEQLELARVVRLRRLVSDGRVPLDRLAGDIDVVRELIKSGEARLRVIVQPWGLEFELVGAAREVAAVASRSPY